MILDGAGRYDTIVKSTLSLHSSFSDLRVRSSSKQSKSVTMITHGQEFPCFEATRCHLTEKDHGFRLTLVKTPKSRNEGNDDSYDIEFTRKRDRSTEWYVQLATATTDEGITMRSVTLRHMQTGKYIYTTKNGKLSTQDRPDDSTTWLMEPTASSTDIGMSVSSNMDISSRSVPAFRNLDISSRSISVSNKFDISSRTAPIGTALDISTRNYDELNSEKSKSTSKLFNGNNSSNFDLSINNFDGNNSSNFDMSSNNFYGHNSTTFGSVENPVDAESIASGNTNASDLDEETSKVNEDTFDENQLLHRLNRGVSFGSSPKHMDVNPSLIDLSSRSAPVQAFLQSFKKDSDDDLIGMEEEENDDNVAQSPPSPLPTFEAVPMSASYYLLPKGLAPKRLACTKNKNSESGLGLTITEASEPIAWELDFTSGELCFIRNPIVHCYIRCSFSGQLTLSAINQGWEVFRFIEIGNGHVLISSWTHGHKYLSSDAEGRVFTSENRMGHWEKWRLSKTSEHGVQIISVAHPGRYLIPGKGENEAEALQTTSEPNDFSKWHLESAHSKMYHISSIGSGGNLQVSSRKRGPFLSKNRRSFEEWKMERTEYGDITLFSKAHSKYLGCTSLGDLHTTTGKGEWVYWEVEESPHGGVYLKSKVHGRYVSVIDGRLSTTEGLENCGEAETFRLEPILPATVGGPRLTGMKAISAVAVVPFAVAGFAATELSLYGVSRVKKKAIKNEIATPVKVKDGSLIDIQRPLCAWKNW